MAKYDLNAMPVVDANGVLLGICTIDDIVDVLTEEQAEDVQKLGAVEPLDIARETNGDVMLLMTLKVATAPEWAGLAMQSGAGKRAVSTLALPEGDGFTRYGLPLKCLRDKGIDMAAVATPFIFASEGAADYTLAEVRLGTDAQVVLPCR
jgi:beta-glucosidase